MPDETIAKAARVTPSTRQLAWHQMEFYGFIHFTVNTFTGKEWGDGTESPAIFNPTEFDAGQWVQVAKDAGMRALILTAKHHDGFCLWPSSHTDHTVKKSPWRDGKGDVVREVSDACEGAGIKFGIYLSPWDRHETSYGSDAYDTFYKNQLRELLTDYGDIFCVWMDGACGEGPNGKRQVYDWEAYYDVIRTLQPRAVISICGPDVRWCGNEAGHCRPSEWSVVPAELRDCEIIANESQQADDPNFALQYNSRDDDLGSREKIRQAESLVWYPAEVDVSIRPGWFYHPEEDDKVRSAESLVELYFQSVGGNASLLLNLPPDKRGLIHENDAAEMQRFGETIKKTFDSNLASGASVVATRDGPDGDLLAAGKFVERTGGTYWRGDEGSEASTLEFDLGVDKTFNVAMLQEHISVGQRVERFRLKVRVDGYWTTVAESTVVGYKRLLKFAPVTARKVRIEILESRIYPTLANFALYYNPDLPVG